MSILPPPDLGLPRSEGYNVRVSIINGLNVDSRMAAKVAVNPPIRGHEWLHMSDYSFMIENEHKSQKVLFDLAMMKNLNDKMAPALKALVGSIEGDVQVDKDVPEHLTEQGMSLSDISAIIWSHAHIDHVGDPSVFPPAVQLVVGPGFRSQYVPGYPANPQALLLDSAFTGRVVRELDFSTAGLTIGGFRAIDYFHDGSFYLLDAPGHTMHHLCALARTTEDSFVLLAADACHHMGQLRPSKYLPLPDTLSPVPWEARSDSGSPQGQLLCTPFRKLLPQSEVTAAFYGLSEGLHEDVVRAEDTLEKLQAFDAADNVLVIIAHDWSLLQVVDLFPKDINQWKRKRWDELARWRFLADFQEAIAVE